MTEVMYLFGSLALVSDSTLAFNEPDTTDEPPCIYDDGHGM